MKVQTEDENVQIFISTSWYDSSHVRYWVPGARVMHTGDRLESHFDLQDLMKLEAKGRVLRVLPPHEVVSS